MSRIYIAFIIIVFSACKDEPVKVPETYSFERDGKSTVFFTGQSMRIAMAEELITALKDFSKSSEELIEMYANTSTTGENVNPFSDATLNQSTKSIKSKVAASIDFFSSNTTASAAIKTDFENWIEAQVTEVFASKTELAAIGKAGQIADGNVARYINAKGLEYDQAINKGLIGALMVDQMLNNYLSPAILDEANNKELNDAGTVADGEIYTTMEHKWDEAYGYLFGAASNPANPLNNLGEDSFLNKYLARVNNDSDFSTIAQQIYDAFKLGRASIVEGDYELRIEQANIIRDLVSQVIAIRAVYYLQAGKNALATGGNNKGGVFHDLSEAYGFIYCLRFTRKSNTNEPYFTKTEVEEFLNLLMIGNGFWEVNAATLNDISEKIAAKFSFNIAEAAE